MIHIEKKNIPEELRRSNIFLYGGGFTGKAIIKLFRQNNLGVRGIIDDDEGLQGERVMGIPVISFQDFCTQCNTRSLNHICVVLSSIYGKTILSKLKVLPELKIYELFEWYNEVAGCEERFNITENDQGLSVLAQEWEALEKNWADKESVRVLNGIQKYFHTKDLNDITDICTDQEQYFIPEVLEALHSPLAVVDGGAYRGELLHSILRNGLRLDKWYCFEPDPANYSMLKAQANRNQMGEKQICVRKGLWSKSGKLYFKGGCDTVSRIVPYETPDFVDVVSLDGFIGKNRCNFIKMDIEGAELQALMGGIDLIKRNRPVLAICIYHSIEDYWKIPKFLMGELDNYRFYVRHHALICNETVLYAIPN